MIYKSDKLHSKLNSDIKSRIFLVGCPRSGTTLLQSFLSSHSRIKSFPESRFYKSLIYPGSLRTHLGVVSKEAFPTLKGFLRDIEREELISYFPNHSPFISSYSNAFIKILDTLAKQSHADMWLEKTPSHVQVVSYIERIVPNSKYIHIVRGAEDVVASLYEVTHKYPETWNGPRSIDQCIDRWINDVQITLLHHGKNNHCVVRYENLIESPENVIKKICQFLAINFEAEMLHSRSSRSMDLIRKREHWKDSVQGEVRKNSTRKFDAIFPENEKLYIAKRLSEHDSLLRSIRSL